MELKRADIHRLRIIANERDLDLRIEALRTLLDLCKENTLSSAEVKALAESRAADLTRKAAALTAMRDALLKLAATCQGDERPDCPILSHLAN